MSDDEKKRSPKDGFSAVEAALDYGGQMFDTSEDFDVAADHVARLLEDVAILFERGSFGTAAFLAITALEETSKAHVGSFRCDKPGPKPKGRDPMLDHKAKHSMAVLPTVFMSERIIAALGQERADALRDEAHTTSFVAAREAALYCARRSSGFVSPKMAISALRAWEFMILAIESADDALVGFTNHSFEVGKGFDALFTRILTQRPSKGA